MPEQTEQVPPALDHTMDTLDGKPVRLAEYVGKVVLMVNVASECGLTPQYEQLQELHDQYSERGLAILGFPCNQFGAQEPGDPEQIRTFCQKNYGVDFDLFTKVDVNGPAACALYKHLTSVDTKPEAAGPVKWNFEKFLIGRTGRVVARFHPKTKPDDPTIIEAIEKELEQV